MKFQYPTSRRTCPDGAPARFLNNALVGHFTIVGDLHDILSKRAYLEIWKWDSGIDWLSWYGQRITSPINATGSTKLKKILSKICSIRTRSNRVFSLHKSSSRLCSCSRSSETKSIYHCLSPRELLGISPLSSLTHRLDPNAKLFLKLRPYLSGHFLSRRVVRVLKLIAVSRTAHDDAVDGCVETELHGQNA